MRPGRKRKLENKPAQKENAGQTRGPHDLSADEHRALARYVVSRWFASSARGKQQWDELVAEALYAFGLASANYDPSRGSWSNWACRAAFFRIATHLKTRGMAVHIHSRSLERLEKPPETVRLDEFDQEVLVADEESNPERQALREEIRCRVVEALAVLPERERAILRLRYGLHCHDGERSLSVTGARLRLSHERVRQIESAAFAVLRPLLADLA